ncbi:MAG: Jag N-terminal domain-containing protein [Deltaproteobacteria bacterium]|nr:Jag N-terminal domain-containing protein [Deltaproteobacteria bacterium]
MTPKLEFKGKDVDEAITQACAKLHVPREELDIEIISTGTSGIFGLCRKQAVIRATKKKTGTEPDSRQEQKPEPVAPAVASRQTARRAPPPEVKVEEEQTASIGSEEWQDEETGENGGDSAEPREQIEPLTPEILSQIKSDLEQLLTLMGFPSDISLEEKNNKALVKITGEHITELTTRDGQALDSIQYLMRKIISKKFPQKIMFAIDAGDFRESRRAELQELALKLAAEVKETEKTRTIPPLNPAERRIVHLVLQEDKTIRSRSVGDGLFKKILIYLPGKGRIRKRPQRRKGRKENLTNSE